MLTGNYSVPEVLDQLNSWGFQPKYGKDELSRSALYRIFTKIFYAGIIKYGGKQKKGKHKAMITLEEYDRIQFLLGKTGKPRRRINNFAYTGIIRCAICGCLICADKKVKTIKKTGREKEYIYYCCTHKKKEYKCKEKSIEVKDLEKQITEELSKYELQKDFKNLFLKEAEKERENKPKEKNIIIKNLEEKIDKFKIEKSNLTRLSCKGLISDEEFASQKNNYEKEIASLEQSLVKTKKEKTDKGTVLEQIDFATRAKKKFEKADNKEKKIILEKIGSNRKIKDKKLLITPYKWLIPIKEDLKPLEAEFLRFELNKTPLNAKQNEAYASLCCELRKGRDSNPRVPLRTNTLAGCPVQPLRHLSF